MNCEYLFVDITLNTLWVNTDASVHIRNSLKVILSVRMLQKGERKLNVTNGFETEVEAIGTLRLILKNDFILNLHDIVYISSIIRNLISISRLDGCCFMF
jgi:hypothetical protein